MKLPPNLSENARFIVDKDEYLGYFAICRSNLVRAMVDEEKRHILLGKFIIDHSLTKGINKISSIQDSGLVESCKSFNPDQMNLLKIISQLNSLELEKRPQLAD